MAFKKTFSYAGFEMQPKKYSHPKIALLNIELELKAERDNAEVRVESVKEYQRIVDAEWKILYEKLDLIHKSGAQVVLSKLPIGDVATQYFADRYVDMKIYHILSVLLIYLYIYLAPQIHIIYRIQFLFLGWLQKCTFCWQT